MCFNTTISCAPCCSKTFGFRYIFLVSFSCDHLILFVLFERGLFAPRSPKFCPTHPSQACFFVVGLVRRCDVPEAQALWEMRGKGGARGDVERCLVLRFLSGVLRGHAPVGEPFGIALEWVAMLSVAWVATPSQGWGTFVPNRFQELRPTMLRVATRPSGGSGGLVYLSSFLTGLI